MSLGANIARLRAEHHLSQGDLAERLDVSRQSVSKWETDASVPDLDKLVKLAGVFGITLDELVHGPAPETAPAPKSEPNPAPAQTVVVVQKMEGRVIAGCILLAVTGLLLVLLTLMGGLAEGLILAAPFVVMALICFLVKRHTGLVCGWTGYGIAYIFQRYATSTDWSHIRYTFSLAETQLSPAHIIVAWVQVAIIWALIFCTARAFRKKPFPIGGKNTVTLVLLWLGWAAASRLLGLIFAPLIAAQIWWLYHILAIVQSLLSLGLLTAAVTVTYRAIRTARNR